MIVSLARETNDKIDKHDARPWMDNYKAITSQYEESRKLKGYRLLITENMVKHTDFLDRIDQSSADFLLEVYKGFKTKGSLQSKHEMLLKLAEFYPNHMIKNLRTEAYDLGLQAKIEFADKLNHLDKEYQGIENLEFWQEYHWKTAKDRVQETKTFLPYFKSV